MLFFASKLNKVNHVAAAVIAAGQTQDDDRLIANLRRTQDNDPVFFPQIAPQLTATDIFSDVRDATYPGADYGPNAEFDVRARFARAIVRRNVIEKIAGERRVDFRNAA